MSVCFVKMPSRYFHVSLVYQEGVKFSMPTGCQVCFTLSWVVKMLPGLLYISLVFLLAWKTTSFGLLSIIFRRPG